MAVRLNYIGIVARDLEASRAFYARLGVVFTGDSVHLEATIEGFRIGLDDEAMIREIDPSWTPPNGQRIGLGFGFDSPNEVDVTFASLVDAGYVGHKPPFDAFWGQRYAVIDDPDGNHVDMYAWLPNADS